jgi:lysozyme family protein
MTEALSNFDRAFSALLGHEGGYVNNPDDPGGETNWGITVAVARENGFLGAMRDMDAEVAKAIYLKRYWLPAFDELPYPVAFQVFDGAVNSGVGQAVRWLQRAVGVADDGKLGPVTLGAAQLADPHSLVLIYNAERLEFMTKLTIWASFGRGWARRIATNLRKGVA